eukprot:Sdes_comp8976_c0_seq1m393
MNTFTGSYLTFEMSPFLQGFIIGQTSLLILLIFLVYGFFFRKPSSSPLFKASKIHKPLVDLPSLKNVLQKNFLASFSPSTSDSLAADARNLGGEDCQWLNLVLYRLFAEYQCNVEKRHQLT